MDIMTYLVISITCVYVKLKVFVHIVMEVAPANTFLLLKCPTLIKYHVFLRILSYQFFIML